MHDITAAAVNPKTFHMDCVDHLCRLENKLSELHDSEPGPSKDKVEVFVGLLVEVTDFSEPRFGPEVFEGIAAKLHDLYENTKLLRNQLGNSSWSTAKLLFGSKADRAREELVEPYMELKKEFKRFLVEYFVVCVKRFDTTADAKRGFLESVDSLISEVDRIWN